MVVDLNNVSSRHIDPHLTHALVTKLQGNRQYTYRVMQSDGNMIFGDVVLDSFNMVYSDETVSKLEKIESESFVFRYVYKCMNGLPFHVCGRCSS